MYYDIVESGIRVKELRSVRNMTRQQLAEEIGISVDALRKIKTGANGAKIDTLVSIAEVFDYWNFVIGDLIILVIVDLAVLEERFKNEEMEVKLINGGIWKLAVEFNNNGSVDEIKVSEHYFNRIVSASKHSVLQSSPHT